MFVETELKTLFSLSFEDNVLILNTRLGNTVTDEHLSRDVVAVDCTYNYEIILYSKIYVIL